MHVFEAKWKLLCLLYMLHIYIHIGLMKLCYETIKVGKNILFLSAFYANHFLGT